ncbi:peptidylprolyl isomerase [Nocardia mangyaensis]|uniref:Peptidyl-prolyl cis-trans isomerase n=1 Tax=Nocardia mangyaensis TaxID=2213200 RepID=A0A1J0VNU6_9NOCA|nr:FKBP-type peptidyl-prolyl cis-trans isomerase [Nocardia mangyaensis]APE33694.1 peptidylprolyl isomerase [Nocardia mangyaensis]
MHSLGRLFGIGLVAAATIATAACGSDSDSSEASTTTAAARTGLECTADDVVVDGGYGDVPTITIPDTCDPPTTLITKDLVPGDGPGAAAGQPLTMNYELVTWSNKETLDSSFQRGTPFQLTLGAGQVIEGWDQGLLGVQQGARRLLIVPPDLGYGAGGNGVAPNETLVFVTDAVQVGG